MILPFQPRWGARTSVRLIRFERRWGLLLALAINVVLWGAIWEVGL